MSRTAPKPVAVDHQCRPLTAVSRAWFHARPRDTHVLVWSVRRGDQITPKARTARLCDAIPWCKAHGIAAPAAT